MYGLSDEEITRICEGKFDGFVPAELTLLRMADALADTPSNVSDELYCELRKHFSQESLMELAATAALENYRHASTGCSTWAAMDFIEKACILKCTVPHKPKWSCHS